MNASQLFVKRWAEKYCPTLPYIMGQQATFVHMLIDAAAGPVNMVFMRSNYPTWEALPEYASIVAGATSSGRDFLSDMLSARSYSAYISDAGWMFGPASIQAAMRGNDVNGTPSYDRVLAALGGSMTFPVSDLNALTAARAGGLKSMSDFQGLACVKNILAALSKCGYADIQGPFICESAQEAVTAQNTAAVRSAKIATEMLNRCGPSRFPVNVMQDPAGGGLFGANNYGHILAFPYYYTVGSQDDSIVEISVGNSYGMAKKGAGGFALGQAVSGNLVGKFVDAHNAILRLNPAFAPAEVKGTFGIQRVDQYWLPLCVLPGKHEFLARCEFENATFSMSERESGIQVLSAVVSSPDSVAVMPVQWYIDYADKEVKKGAANSDRLKKASADMEEYVSKSITAITYATPVMLASNLIETTQLYRDYKKAKEKACEENDFMDQQFTEKMKYGELNTLINGSRSTRTFYGFRDANEIAVLPGASVGSTAGWTLAGGSQVVTARRADGTFAPSYTKETGYEMLRCIATGATLNGVTVDQQLTIWGLDPGQVNSQSQGLNEQVARASGGLSKGNPTAYYDFRWQSVGITGVADVKSMTPDAAARAAMTSKGAIQPLGNHMLSILNKEMLDFYKEVLLGLPAA